jgi:hypothetical protein
MCESNLDPHKKEAKRLTTIPRAGFIPRCDIPVLNKRDGISRIAVPVVSDPVPAVVGIAINGRNSRSTGRPLPIGALIKSIKSASW